MSIPEQDSAKYQKAIYAERKPTSLLVLASLFVFLSIFDNTVVLSGIPLLRNPAAVAALFLVLYFLVNQFWVMRVEAGPQLWTVVFLLTTMVIEAIRVMARGEVTQGWLFLYLQWVQMIVLFFILLELAKDPRAFRYIWTSFILAAVYMSILGLMTPTGFAVEDGQRLGYEGENLNRQAYMYAMGVVTLVWLLIERWPRFDLMTPLIFIATGLLAFSVLNAGSRSAFLGMVVGLCLVLMLSLRQRKVPAYLTVVPLLIVFGVLLLVNNSLVLERLLAAWSGEQDGKRGEIFSAAWDLLKVKPHMGYGMQFVDALGNHLGLSGGLSSHNSFFKVALTFGVMAAVIWIILIGCILLHCWKARHGPVGVLFLALTGVSLIYGFFDELSFNKFFWVMLALASRSAIYNSVDFLRSLEHFKAILPAKWRTQL